MILQSFIDLYLSRRPKVTAEYAAALRRTAVQYGQFLGRPARLADLADAPVGCWLARQSRRVSAVTVNNRRRMLLTIWRAAWRARLTAELPREVPRLREPRRIPEAWTAAEIRRLVTYCRDLPGSVADLPAGRWWSSLVLTTYWTGARIGALLASTWADCDLRGGWLRLRAESQKNAHEQLHRLPGELLIELAPIERTACAPIWPWPYHRRTLFKYFRRHIEAAGLPAPRTGRQLFHRLRRTHLSYCAAADLELARREAGHASAATTLRHYIDPRIAGGTNLIGVLPEVA